MRIIYRRFKPEFQLELCNTYLEYAESAETLVSHHFAEMNKTKIPKKIETQKHKIKFYCSHWSFFSFHRHQTYVELTLWIFRIGILDMISMYANIEINITKRTHKDHFCFWFWFWFVWDFFFTVGNSNNNSQICIAQPFQIKNRRRCEQRMNFIIKLNRINILFDWVVFNVVHKPVSYLLIYWFIFCCRYIAIWNK